MAKRNVKFFLNETWTNRYETDGMMETVRKAGIQTGYWAMGLSNAPIPFNNIPKPFDIGTWLEKFDFIIILGLDEKDIDYVSGVISGVRREKPSIEILGLLA